MGADAARLISVGGAGSLRMPDGSQAWDMEGLPDSAVRIMHAHGDALDFFRTVPDVGWTVFSPAAAIEPRERTGGYRTALDDLVIDAGGAAASPQMTTPSPASTSAWTPIT